MYIFTNEYYGWMTLLDSDKFTVVAISGVRAFNTKRDAVGSVIVKTGHPSGILKHVPGIDMIRDALATH